MSAQLAYAVDTLNEAFLNPPEPVVTVSPEERLRVVSGFTVPVPDTELIAEERERRMDVRRWLVSEFKEHEAKLRAELGELGITPLATIQTNAFNQLCDGAGLVRLEPDAEGRVSVDVDGFLQSIDNNVRKLRGFVAAACFGAGALFGVIHESDVLQAIAAQGYRGSAIMVGLFCGFLAGSAGAMLGRVIGSIVGFCYRSSAISAVDHWTPAERAEFLERPIPKDCKHDIAVQFPEPPADVAALLRTMSEAGNAIWVAADPRAVMFAEPLSEVLRGVDWERRAKAHAEFWEAVLLDPIIYVEQGAAVAILAQFGEFDIEKEVLNRITASVALV